MPYLNRAEAEAYLKNPRIQDLLRVIKFAEGTGDDGPYAKPEVENYSYKMLRGGGLFNDLSRHPDHGTPYPGGRPAGFAQFFPWVFQEAAVPLDLKDFSPHSQKLAAIYEADRRLKNFTGRQDGKDLGGLSYLRYHDFDKDTMDNLAGAWASFPNFEGKSYYNQPAKSHDQLIRSYLGEDEYNYRNSAEAKAKAEAWKNMSDDEKLKFAGPLPAIPN